jgi:hypothetical protein
LEVPTLPESAAETVVRVGMPGTSAFVLRKGEEGLSVFDPRAVESPVTDDEILDAFRPGSILVERSGERIAALGLVIVATEGAATLPDRVRAAHREIRPGAGMSRPAFKAALKMLEER